MDLLIVSLGLIALTQGLTYLRPKQARKFFKRWNEQSDHVIRSFGAVAFCVGAIILYIGIF